MQSLIVGISRPGKSDGVPLIDDAKYVSRCGSFPEVTFTIGCEQAEFFKNVAELRYVDGDPSASSGAIAFFQKLTSDLFSKLKYITIDVTDKTPLHIRLITTPMELAQLPFEFVPAPWVLPGDEPVPLLADQERIITLTREVLQASEARYIWPKQPRILFAWAAPSRTVPHALHRDALIEALYPLITPNEKPSVPEPNTDPFFTELADASLASLKKEIEEANKAGKPYSHIHLLAHGGHIADFLGVSFRLILCDNYDPDGYKADGAEIIDAIIPDKNTAPIVLTFSACDSGNTGNVLAPSGSLVYQVHQAGIPCVFASQFPLTQDGSVLLVKSLYTDFIKGCDPREALYNARKQLKQNKTHDWASLIAYARFPDDINEQLHAIKLKVLFTSMKTTGLWVDHVLKYKDTIGKDEKLFNAIAGRMENSIKELSQRLIPGTVESSLPTEALRGEHLGLLGSAYKRQAEFFYRLVEFYPEKENDYVGRSVAALHKAREFYYAGYDADINNHWVTMQYLSLKIVLGEFAKDDKELWDHIYFVTKIKEQKEKEAEAKMKALKIKQGIDEKDIPESIDKLWVWGTLTELYMIKPLTVGDDIFEQELKISQQKAVDYSKLIKDAGNDEVIDSTKRQLDRYISWWPEIYKGSYMDRLRETAVAIRSKL